MLISIGLYMFNVVCAARLAASNSKKKAVHERSRSSDQCSQESNANYTVPSNPSNPEQTSAQNVCSGHNFRC